MAATSGTFFYKPHLGKLCTQWETNLFTKHAVVRPQCQNAEVLVFVGIYSICSCLIHITTKINPVKRHVKVLNHF